MAYNVYNKISTFDSSLKKSEYRIKDDSLFFDVMFIDLAETFYGNINRWLNLLIAFRKEKHELNTFSLMNNTV